MRRRQFLLAVGGAGATVTGGVAVNNVLLGYGRLTGENLTQQDLKPLVDERISPDDGRDIAIDGTEITLGADALSVGDATLEWDAPRHRSRRLEREYDIPAGSLTQLVSDVPAIRAGDYTVEAYTRAEFFERLADAETNPHTVEALRGPVFDGVDPDTVETFTGADAAAPGAIVLGLVSGFREHTFYDAPRYTAGATDDNVLGGRGDLRRPFESPTDFEALLDGENNGTFCYDYSHRAIEALHSVQAAEQTVPVAGFHVSDPRHKHAYPGIASLLSGDGETPTLAVTFVDYTLTTAAHDFGLTLLRGDDPNAYNSWHRAERVFWDRYWTV